MDYQKLVPHSFDLTPYRFGIPQQSGAMTVLPIFGADIQGRFVSPLSGLKLSQVRGYGNMELLTHRRVELRSACSSASLSLLCTWVISKRKPKTMPCAVPLLLPLDKN